MKSTKAYLLDTPTYCMSFVSLAFLWWFQWWTSEGWVKKIRAFQIHYKNDIYICNILERLNKSNFINYVNYISNYRILLIDVFNWYSNIHDSLHRINFKCWWTSYDLFKIFIKQKGFIWLKVSRHSTKVWISKESERIEASNIFSVSSDNTLKLRCFTFSLCKVVVEVSNRLLHRKSGIWSFPVVAKRSNLVQ